MIRFFISSLGAVLFFIFSNSVLASQQAVCKITFSDDDKSPRSYTCTASYLGGDFFLTARHCIYSHQEDPHDYSEIDFSVNPATVQMECLDQSQPIDVRLVTSARDLKSNEEPDGSVYNQTTVRDFAIIKIPNFKTRIKPVSLYYSAYQIPKLKVQDKMWFSSYGSGKQKRFNNDLHNISLPNAGRLKAFFVSPFYGILYYPKNILAPGDSGAPLILQSQEGLVSKSRVIGVASNMCPGLASCGGGHDEYNLVTWEILKNRFCTEVDLDLRKFLHCQDSKI